VEPIKQYIKPIQNQPFLSRNFLFTGSGAGVTVSGRRSTNSVEKVIQNKLLGQVPVSGESFDATLNKTEAAGYFSRLRKGI